MSKRACQNENIERLSNAEYSSQDITEFEQNAYARVVNGRYSCRAYLPEPVDHNTIRKILGLAQRTASWCNTQPWRVLITAENGTKRFREALLKDPWTDDQETDIEFPLEYKGIYLERRRACGAQLYRSLGISRHDNEGRADQAMDNFRFFGAPHTAIIAVPAALGVYGAIDCGAYVSNFMLAASSMGVASIAQAALAKKSAFIRRYFSLDSDLRIVCGISFGYAAQEHPVNSFRTDRALIDQSVRWETA